MLYEYSRFTHLVTSSELQLPASDFQINAFILILGGLYVLSLRLFVAFCQKYTNFSSHLLKILKNSLLWCCCCCSVAQLCPTLWGPKDCSTPGFPVLYYLPEFVQTHAHWVGDAVQPSHPLAPLPFRPSLFPSITVFSSGLAVCIRGPEYWSFSFSISPSSEYSGLIFFRMDWFDLAVQGTLKSLLPHHSGKASVLQCSVFFMGPTHISIHDYWKKHSFDYMDLCQ